MDLNPPCGFDRRVRGLLREAPAFLGTAMRTIVYVDGFNLYFGCLKGTPWKWFDLVVLSKNVLQQKHMVAAAK